VCEHLCTVQLKGEADGNTSSS